MSNEQIYTELMRLKANNPKRYFFLRLQEKYDLIVSAYERKNRVVVIERTNDLNDWLRSVATIYGITAPEIKQFFIKNKMSFNFKFQLYA